MKPAPSTDPVAKKGGAKPAAATGHAVEARGNFHETYMVIRALLRTEKGSLQVVHNQYLFNVKKTANKIQIKRAVEELYKVKVDKVNTQVMPGKRKRVRQQLGMTPTWKKAVVTLKTGHKIDLA